MEDRTPFELISRAEGDHHYLQRIGVLRDFILSSSHACELGTGIDENGRQYRDLVLLFAGAMHKRPDMHLEMQGVHAYTRMYTDFNFIEDRYPWELPTFQGDLSPPRSSELAYPSPLHDSDVYQLRPSLVPRHSSPIVARSPTTPHSTTSSSEPDYRTPSPYSSTIGRAVSEYTHGLRSGPPEEIREIMRAEWNESWAEIERARAAAADGGATTEGPVIVAPTPLRVQPAKVSTYFASLQAYGTSDDDAASCTGDADIVMSPADALSRRPPTPYTHLAPDAFRSTPSPSEHPSMPSLVSPSPSPPIIDPLSFEERRRALLENLTDIIEREQYEREYEAGQLPSAWERIHDGIVRLDAPMNEDEARDLFTYHEPTHAGLDDNNDHCSTSSSASDPEPVTQPPMLQAESCDDSTTPSPAPEDGRADRDRPREERTRGEGMVAYWAHMCRGLEEVEERDADSITMNLPQLIPPTDRRLPSPDIRESYEPLVLLAESSFRAAHPQNGADSSAGIPDSPVLRPVAPPPTVRNSPIPTLPPSNEDGVNPAPITEECACLAETLEALLVQARFAREAREHVLVGETVIAEDERADDRHQELSQGDEEYQSLWLAERLLYVSLAAVRANVVGLGLRAVTDDGAAVSSPGTQHATVLFSNVEHVAMDTEPQLTINPALLEQQPHDVEMPPPPPPSSAPPPYPLTPTSSVPLWGPSLEPAEDPEPDFGAARDNVLTLQRIGRSVSDPHGQLATVHFADAEMSAEHLYSFLRTFLYDHELMGLTAHRQFLPIRVPGYDQYPALSTPATHRFLVQSELGSAAYFIPPRDRRLMFSHDNIRNEAPFAHAAWAALQQIPFAGPPDVTRPFLVDTQLPFDANFQILRFWRSLHRITYDALIESLNPTEFRYVYRYVNMPRSNEERTALDVDTNGLFRSDEVLAFRGYEEMLRRDDISFRYRAHTSYSTTFLFAENPELRYLTNGGFLDPAGYATLEDLLPELEAH